MGALDGAASMPGGDERTADQRRADALTAMARGVLDSGVGPDGTPLPVVQHRRPHLQVTVEARGPGSTRGPDGLETSPGPSVGDVPDTGLGPLGGVAQLAGYGPVPISAVADLVEDAGSTAVPVPVDRAGVPVIDVPGTDAYRPSAELARAVVARDRTCRFPGCRVPAWRCDIDHIRPFDPDRPARWQTIEENLQALCRHHHRLKTHGGWYASRDPVSGATLWRSPLGQVRTVSPEPAIPGSRPPFGASVCSRRE
ncbi:DUF222 domain-containing protein [Actinotalea lenta]